MSKSILLCCSWSNNNQFLNSGYKIINFVVIYLRYKQNFKGNVQENNYVFLFADKKHLSEEMR